MTHLHKIVREQIQLLRDAGHTYRTIGQASGVSRHVVATMVGRTNVIKPENFEAIMSLVIRPPWETPGVTLTDHSLISGTGTVRRLRALARMGYSAPQVSRGTGLPESHLRVLINSPASRVEIRTARMIREFYRAAVSRVPEGKSVLWVQRWAERNGWPGPALWDDIDNDELPEGSENLDVLIDYVRDNPGQTMSALLPAARSDLAMTGKMFQQLINQALDSGDLVRVRRQRTVRVYTREEAGNA